MREHGTLGPRFTAMDEALQMYVVLLQTAHQNTERASAAKRPKVVGTDAGDDPAL